MLVVPFECIQNATQVNECSHHNKHVKYLMRAPPNIKVSRMQPFRESGAIYKGANQNQATLRIVIGKARLFIELLEREQSRRVDDGDECREARNDKDGKPEQAVLTTLVGGMVHDVDRQGAEGANLIRYNMVSHSPAP